MDDDELALFFAANKENEELREKLKENEELREKLKENEDLREKLNKEVERLKGHINGLKVSAQPAYVRYDKMLAFIKLLDDYPMFWSISYKRSIRQFLIDNFPIKYGEIPEG